MARNSQRALRTVEKFVQALTWHELEVPTKREQIKRLEEQRRALGVDIDHLWEELNRNRDTIQELNAELWQYLDRRGLSEVLIGGHLVHPAGWKKVEVVPPDSRQFEFAF